jgi:hypothetical protein
MKSGMLWYDNDPHISLPVKIDRAAEYYRRKYGSIPTLCMVNPSMLADSPDLNASASGKLTVQPHRAILPGHLWIGSEEKN